MAFLANLKSKAKSAKKHDDSDVMKSIEKFFVYGTLRDDDDSGAQYTKDWCDGGNATNGKIFGFKMYQSKAVSYPFAVKTDNQKDFIIGRVIDFGKKFKQKLKVADQIEGYNEKNIQNLYDREIVTVYAFGDNPNKANKVEAVVYYQTNVSKYRLSLCDPVPNGDWLQRIKYK